MSSGTGRLHAGVARVDITPVAGTQLSGSVGQYRPATLVLDPLYASVVVLACGEDRMCIVSLDLTLLTREIADRIRLAVGKRHGIDPDAVMIHVTQTHTAPSLGHCMLSAGFPGIDAQYEWILGGDPAYDAETERKVLEAIRTACESMRPVRIGAGSGIEGRFAHNRRAVRRDGSVFMPGRSWGSPLGPRDILYMEGPIDPEVSVVCLQESDLSIRSLLVNHTCHPVHVFPRPVVSSDWPGALASALRERHGSACVPVVLNGPCGNINPWPPFDPDYVDDHHRMGRALADVSDRVLETIEFSDCTSLDWRSIHLRIPMRAPDPGKLREAKRMLEKHPEPLWVKEGQEVDIHWMLAATMIDMNNQRGESSEFDYEIQILRVGDIAIVGLPGEPFVEGGLRIKAASPVRNTLIVHDINQYVGYIPTREAFARGGHELSTGNWSKLVPEALDMIVDASVVSLREMFTE